MRGRDLGDLNALSNFVRDLLRKTSQAAWQTALGLVPGTDIASLSGGKVPTSQLPDSIIGGLNYQGTWNASTNTPTLSDPPDSSTKGHYYKVNTAGTQFSLSFAVGDFIVSNGTGWDKIDNTDPTADESTLTSSGGVLSIKNGGVAAAQVAASLKPSGSAATTDEALRALGTGANNAAAGNDSRLSDARTPTDNSVSVAKLTTATKTLTLNFLIDGGGSTITTGIKGDMVVDFDFTIKQATLLADQTGSIVVDLWKDTYANYPPTNADSICASAKPTISSATKSQDATLTGWTVNGNAGDIIRVNVDSITTCTRVLLSLKIERR